MTRRSSKTEFSEELVVAETTETPDDTAPEVKTVEPPFLTIEETPNKPEPEKPPVLAPRPERVPPVVRAQQRNVPRFSQIRK